jgi:shikimate kinase
MNIVLIGYRASGKTDVGKRLSNLLNLPFYDTDDLIRERTGKSVRQMVREGGWPAFRTAEKAVIAGLSGLEGAVIALGGGAVTEPENVAILKEKGFFVWLEVDETAVIERMKGDVANEETRPPLGDGGMAEEVREMLAERTPLYRAHADLTVDTTDKSAEQVALEIAGAIKTGKGGADARAGVKN